MLHFVRPGWCVIHLKKIYLIRIRKFKFRNSRIVPISLCSTCFAAVAINWSLLRATWRLWYLHGIKRKWGTVNSVGSIPHHWYCQIVFCCGCIMKFCCGCIMKFVSIYLVTSHLVFTQGGTKSTRSKVHTTLWVHNSTQVLSHPTPSGHQMTGASQITAITSCALSIEPSYLSTRQNDFYRYENYVEMNFDFFNFSNIDT